MPSPSAYPDDGSAGLVLAPGAASGAPAALPPIPDVATAPGLAEALTLAAAQVSPPTNTVALEDPSAPEDPAPLVDPAALQELGDQLENPALAKGFARDYAKMWDQRYSALASALERRDLPGSLDAVLSLKTSSAMVGGLRLAKLAGELEGVLRAGDMDRALSLLLDVAQRGGETLDELQFSYVLREG
ncbi:Hpt domain-containing protein [Arthrobacter sp. NPDC058192]|uniref:Hpt domain-containing protein n=1 Tax=Arthrobacter sp. NPDC058192 TaxID=3346372 RepID=UPI0036E37510